ncbi:MAG: hypothetical protein QF926_03460 [Alphaproteobacteria bacterium]|nr:hypothetical protein [Alphaproteobacteria bacterium]MDP6515670.1 hypothetical protein [Alphaproteobacteria bacterium]
MAPRIDAEAPNFSTETTQGSITFRDWSGDGWAIPFTHPKDFTLVNWKRGEDVIIVPAVSDENAREKYPGGRKAPKPYPRIVPRPQ